MMDINLVQSEVILKDLSTLGFNSLGNENISQALIPNNNKEKERLIADATYYFECFLKSLLINYEKDPNMKETAKRVTKMYFNEVFKGRYLKKPDMKVFPNTKEYDQIYLVGPIEVKSTCAHHFMPIIGKCWIGVFPNKKLLGLSKFNRLVDWVCSRPQIQEDMTEQIANELDDVLITRGLAVVIKAKHLCVTHRGVNSSCSDMTTSVVRGNLRNNSDIKKEFFDLLKGMEGYGK